MKTFTTISTAKAQQLPRLLLLVAKLSSQFLASFIRIEHTPKDSYPAISLLLGVYPCQQFTNVTTHAFRPEIANIGGSDWNSAKNIRGGSPC
jgi:hypothetical protein